MKKILVVLMLLLVTVGVFGTTYYVNQDGTKDFTTIQAAINVTRSGDRIIVAAGIYVENIKIKRKSISLVGAENAGVIIDGNQGSRVITIDNCNNSTLSNLTIINGLNFVDDSGGRAEDEVYEFFVESGLIDGGRAIDSARGSGIYCVNSNVTLSNLTIAENDISVPIGDGGLGLGAGIYCEYSTLDISNSVIRNNTITTEQMALGFGGGIFSFASNLNLDEVTILNNSVTAAGAGMFLGKPASSSNNYVANLNKVVIGDNVASNNVTVLTYGAALCSGNCEVNCDDTTIVKNIASQNTALYLFEGSTTTFENSIVWDGFIDLSPVGEINTLTIDYSDIEGGYEGEGNIDADPLLDVNYQPMWTTDTKSPCIDTGNPDSEWDIDDTPADMGAVPTIDHDYYDRRLESGWTWLCFPILDHVYKNGDIAKHMLADIISNQSPQYSDLDHALWREFNHTEDDFIQRNDLNNAWSNLTHEFTSVQGYKFRMQDNVEANLEMSGWLASPYTYFPPLEANCEQWMGYFLEERFSCEDAFGNNWDNVITIEAQDWYYVANTNGPSSTIHSLEPEQMYIVTFYEDVDNFQWDNNFEQEAEPFVRLEPQYFEYEEKADYEVIDVLDIPEDVVEIGVYQDDRCVGAVVTDEDAEQILVYSDRMNRDETVFTFQLVYGRSGAVPLNNYTVYDEKVGDYVKGNITPGRQDYSAIRFEGGEPTDPPQVMQLLGNYPNPFTGETTISFSLTTNLHEKARIEIFNIRGQKVENLQITNSPNQQIIWNANNFANGVYFYKLVVDGIAVDTKKMILLK
ncbi:MAG: T9SS type A sorting domain-containing protein [Bacteroidetes bacterium]|jgi:hypothetical protein|nr:T9SS type A sorting domain-containing protein [Candidatus Cloacimonadota bacterium]MBT7041723.1 T9SS type A sorting domain-containing protein [Bacteroidota bacterium]